MFLAIINKVAVHIHHEASGILEYGHQKCDKVWTSVDLVSTMEVMDREVVIGSILIPRTRSMRLYGAND